MAIKFERFGTEHYLLARNFRVNPSSCENPDYFTDYLLFNAIEDGKKGMGTTRVLVECNKTEEKIIAYITLRASSYTKEYNNTVIGNPALEIFELAVADGKEGEGIGTKLVKYAITMAADLREKALGVRYVLLCATPKAVSFYEKVGFAKVDQFGEVPRDGTNRKCVPMYLELPVKQ